MFLPAILQVSTSKVPAHLIFLLSVAVAFALPMSFVLTWLYYRAVRKSIARSISMTAAGASTFTSEPAEQPAPQTTELVIVDVALPAPTEGKVEDLYADVIGGPMRAASVYIVAGVCYALILTLAALVGGFEIHPEELVPLFWIFVWPTVLIVNLVAAATRRAKLANLAIYFFGLIVVSVVAMASDVENDYVTVRWWLLFNLPTTLTFIAFLNRRTRAVGPLVLIFMIIVVTGMRLVLAINTRTLDRLTSMVETIVRSEFAAFLLLVFLCLLVSGLVAWAVLQMIRRRYEQKKISDQSITIDAISLLFGFGYSLWLARYQTVLIFSGLVAFLVFKHIAYAALRNMHYEKARSLGSYRLLVLRVFSSSKQSRELFEALATHWRHVGSIELLAGPDLATTTVEPHEFMDFVSGKLASRFVDGPQALFRRCLEIDTLRDRDCRFRINDFFCYVDTWKMVLSQLVKEAHAVVMDLRGFTSDNEGCIYEISELINVVPLERVVFIIETFRDEELLLENVRRSWSRMSATSPNRRATCGRIQLFRFTRSPSWGLRQLLRALCLAANPARKRSHVSNSLHLSNAQDNHIAI